MKTTEDEYIDAKKRLEKEQMPHEIALLEAIVFNYEGKSKNTKNLFLSKLKKVFK